MAFNPHELYLPLKTNFCASIFSRCAPRRGPLPDAPRDGTHQATRIQAAVRGYLHRTQSPVHRSITAEIAEHYRTITDGTKSVTIFIIIVRHGGRSWEVEHRYSDWLELDSRLSEHLKQRPALPPRAPLRGSVEMFRKQVTVFRIKALDSYLQQVTNHEFEYVTCLNEK